MKPVALPRCLSCICDDWLAIAYSSFQSVKVASHIDICGNVASGNSDIVNIVNDFRRGNETLDHEDLSRLSNGQELVAVADQKFSLGPALKH